MVVVPDYLWVRDEKFNKIGTIRPEKFTVEMSHGKANGLSFTLPSSEKLIEVGSYVNLGDTIYGGRITERTINLTKKTVEYYGKSYLGTFADQVFEIGTENSVIKQSNTDDYPVAPGVQCLGVTSCQSALSGTYNGVSYPKNGIVPLMHRNFGLLGLSYDATLLQAYPYPSGGSSTITVSPGTTIQRFLQILVYAAEVVRLKYIADDSLGYKLLFQVRPSVTWGYGVNDNDDIGDVKISDYLRLTARWDKASYHYYANNETYKSQNDVYNNGFPNDAMYPGMTQWTEWNPNNKNNAVNQAELKALRESLPSNAIDTEIGWSLKVNPDSKYPSYLGGIAIGDKITLVNRQDKYTMDSRWVIGERVEMENGSSRLIYSLGDYGGSIT